MTEVSTIGITEAAVIVGVAPNTLRYRVLSKRMIPVARYSPLRIRLADLFQNLDRLRARDARGRLSAHALTARRALTGV